MKSIRIPKLNLPVYTANYVQRSAIAVDQSRSDKDFLNEAGFVANDIYLINKANTVEKFELLASRLQEIGQKSVDNTNKSDRDIILETIPCWVQTPAEIGRFADYYNATHPVVQENGESDLDPGKSTSVESVATESVGRVATE